MRAYSTASWPFLAGVALVSAFAAASCAQGTALFGGGGNTGTGGSGIGGDSGADGNGGGSDGGGDAPSDAPVACVHQSDCTPVNDACNVGSCVNNVCVKVPGPDGPPCDTGLYCMVEGFCQSGMCVGSPKPCPGTDDCNVGLCDEASQTCSTQPGNDGAFCTPMNDVCYTSGFCSFGTCIGGTSIDCSSMSDQCNDGTCDPVMGCVKSPKPNGTACTDGLFCTAGDVCTAGVCGGTPTTCGPPSSECQIVTCVEATHACLPGNAPDGTACSTMNMCVTSEACTAGECTGGVPTNEGMACPGNGACVSGAKCTQGACTGTAVSACAAGDGCCPMGCTNATDSDCNCNVNLALTATASSSPGGTIAPHLVTEVNNGIGKSHCAQYAWIANKPAPAGAYFELDWPAAVTIGSFYIEAPALDGTGQCPENPGRNIAAADVQTWNGTGWVTQTQFANKSGDVQINLSPPVTTTKLRLFNVIPGPTCPGGCNNNSIMFEWHVFNAGNCIPPAD